jgi:hypothetical protein
MNKKTTIKQTILCYIPAFLFRFEQFTFISGNVCRGVKLTTHLHLVLRSRMRGAIHPLPPYAFMAWCSVKAQGQLYHNLTGNVFVFGSYSVALRL